MSCSASTAQPGLSRVPGASASIRTSASPMSSRAARAAASDPALAGVEVLEQSAAIGIGLAAGKRAPPAQRIPFRSFDFGDVSAKVDEQFAAVGA